EVFDSSNLNTPAGTGFTDAQGNFKVSLTTPITGASVIVRVVDAAGVIGPATTLVTPPAAPVAPHLSVPPAVAAIQDTGTSAVDGLTKVNKPKIDNVGGPAVRANALIKVYVDGFQRSAGEQTVADGAGFWSFTFTSPLPDGPHDITVTQT